MRILMVAGVYALSGVSTVIENLADQLSKRGIDVNISALTFRKVPPNATYSVNTLQIHHVSKLKRFLDGFDVIHNHHPIMNYLALISHRPFVYHYYGTPISGRGFLLRCSMFLSCKMMNRALDYVITVSESGANELKRFFNLDNAHVIYLGVNNNNFKYGLDEKYREGTPQFLFVGNLYEHKNVEELIWAFKKMVKIYPKAHLQIVGTGNTYGHLKRIVVEFDLEDHIRLVGHVRDDELPYYYASCDLYTTASRWELFGLPLLEAMACGKPILASSIPPHEELLNKSKAGITYTKGNIEELCEKMTKTYEERNRYRSNALRFAKEHDWSLIADQVLRIYSQLIHKKELASKYP